MRDHTLAVDIKYPAPGQAIIDIRRWVGTEPDNLVPHFVGLMMEPSEIPLLQAALAETLVILAGTAATPEPSPAQKPMLTGAPPMPTFLLKMMEMEADKAPVERLPEPKPEPVTAEASPAETPRAEPPAEEKAPTPVAAEPSPEVIEARRRRAGLAAHWG